MVAFVVDLVVTLVDNFLDGTNNDDDGDNDGIIMVLDDLEGIENAVKDSDEITDTSFLETTNECTFGISVNAIQTTFLYINVMMLIVKVK